MIAESRPNHDEFVRRGLGGLTTHPTPLARVIPHHNQCQALTDKIKSYKAQGNHWLALKFAKQYEKNWQDYFIHGHLSEIYIGLEDEESAGKQGVLSYQAASNDEERLGSCYKMAMLSGRWHKNPDQDEAQDYLKEAGEIIKKTEASLIDQIKITNAWAYFYMKNGDLSKALHLMESPLISSFICEATSTIDCDIAEVLNANHAKLLMIKGEHKKAEEKLKQNIVKNPWYPVYHLDLARCYFAADQVDQAHKVLEQSMIRFPCLPDFHTMKMQISSPESDEGHRHAKLANQYNIRDDPGPGLDLVASHLSRKQLNQAKSLLDSINFEKLKKKHAEDYCILKTEILIKEKSISEAHTYLSKKIDLMPYSTLLKENLTILQGLLPQ